ncbi:flagellar basal body-associated FliL family protein [Marinobacter sp.]|uniref:flagellar basal body-associated FliL family protein n=1 Tax=Marinobacter sp. TaxID=50741 RepID=UPI002B4A46FD|nr:flagellar basal body-associated FliL family protein [Marinobacter sp.]HKK57482.1 flagellar basal body-associated FliL family protein [Marinobacter sp.]
MISDLKRFLLILALVMPLAQFGFAQEAASEEAQAEQQDETEEAGVTDYVPMDPAFVTHIGEPGPTLVYLKAAVTLRTSRASTREALEAHMPRLRHELVMLFGEQTDVKALAGNAGQSDLRAAAKQRINQVLEEQQTGEEIADVLFTEFVVQR